MANFSQYLKKTRRTETLKVISKVLRRNTMHTNLFKPAKGPACRALFAILAIAALLIAAGCGGGGSSSAAPSPTPVPAGASSTQFRIGDAPVDSVIAFEVTVSALSLTPSAGGAPLVVPLPAGNRLELSHSSAKFEPFAIGSLPQGSFSSA